MLLIRAEDERILFGFWRGQRRRDVEPRPQPGGKYEMATMVLAADSAVAATRVRQPGRAALALNRTLGDPTAIAR